MDDGLLGVRAAAQGPTRSKIKPGRLARLRGAAPAARLPARPMPHTLSACRACRACQSPTKMCSLEVQHAHGCVQPHLEAPAPGQLAAHVGRGARVPQQVVQAPPRAVLCMVLRALPSGLDAVAAGFLGLSMQAASASP